MNKIRYILPTILATITGKTRYLPTLDLSSNLWTHSFFRVYEYIFGRKHGIRPDTSSGKYRKEDGTWFEYQVGHSFEGKCAVLEFHIRKLVKKLINFDFQLPYLVVLPNNMLQTSNGLSLPTGGSLSPYRFAIAYDALGESTTGFGAGAITWTHVSSGSDRALFISTAMPDNLTWAMTVTYNAVGSFTDIGHTATDNGTADWWIGLFGKVAQTSGSNTCSVTSSNTLGGCSTSYTGVKQTGFPDSSGTANSGGSNVTSQNVSSTVVASGCWQVLSARGMTGILAAGTATTLRGFGYMPTNKYLAIMDSNGTVGTGSQSLQMTGSSQKMGGVVSSFEPAGSSSAIKTINGLAVASVKTVNGLSTASVKTVNGLA